MNRARANALLFWGSIALCYLLQLMPLPQALLPFKPFWLALVLVYWALETPERIGLGLAFVLGLAGDAISGELLGEQALRLCILCFILLRFRSRLRFFPMWQQSVAVLALVQDEERRHLARELHDEFGQSLTAIAAQAAAAALMAGVRPRRRKPPHRPPSRHYWTMRQRARMRTTRRREDWQCRLPRY